MRRTVLFLFPVLALIVSLNLLSCGGGGGEEESSSTGPLDGKFGKGGKVTTVIGDGGDDVIRAIAVQSDGKLVAAGYSNEGTPSNPVYRFALVRYNTDGSLDTSFGTGFGTGDCMAGGCVTTDINGVDDRAFALAIQPDGKLVAAGYSYSGNRRRFALVRYDIDGNLDTSFGPDADGTVLTDINSVDDEIFALAIQPSDGFIVAAGYSYQGAQYVFAVARYDTNGSLDATFSGGVVTTDIGDRDQAFALVVQPADEKLVVGGTSKNDASGVNEFALARYDTTGNLDSTFGTGGVLTTPIGGGGDDAIQSVAIQPDGKVVAAGYSYNIQYVFALVRYNIDGTIDPTFGLSGIVTTASAPLGKSDFPYALAIHPNGKLVVAGRTNTGNQTVFTNKFAVARYSPFGSLDTSFSSKGIAVTSIGNYDDQAFALAIQPDGKLVTAGKSVDKTSGASQFALIRYSPSP
jgi:uncharacterized delta-60 repeat protein